MAGREPLDRFGDASWRIKRRHCILTEMYVLFSEVQLISNDELLFFSACKKVLRLICGYKITFEISSAALVAITAQPMEGRWWCRRI